ncbi:NirA family protein [Synoicihabitans lomoniglobus]|uniref:NirA family protein n=1 Tax=Synoicihabitans lomoniglobus TaxID=2909285 RepID=A0AAF0CRQ6_9BACT|nr:NirA family protein [Opitutaceae bacterium LMO-M01]WED66756.1 NirA family protein [Opitutaceae bacterium LMO-M01]
MSNSTPFPPVSGEFSTEQKEYLQGFLAGAVASGQLPFVGIDAQGQLTGDAAAGGVNLGAPPVEDSVFGTPIDDLCKPEVWKHELNGLDVWEKMVEHAEADRFPDDADCFRFKFFGLFHVAPAQDSFMLRLRIPAGIVTSTQLRGLADLADDLGNGRLDITTRANFQIREFKPKDIINVLTRVQDLGLTSKGSGADNIRNITATPTAGFDRDEILDVRPYARAVHHFILNNRDLYGLPRKFNIAFDGGGTISAAADTNDIGFFAVRVGEGVADIEPGVYFRVCLGGITGHKDFARDTGLLIKPSEAVPLAAAMIRVFAESGDRTNRKKARLKYVLDSWGFDKFIAAAQEKLAFDLVRLPREKCAPRHQVVKHGHVGVYRQSEQGLNYIGPVVPVGQLSTRQVRRVADLAENFGRGEIRLTVWQNFLLPYVPNAFTSSVEHSLERIGLTTKPSTTAGCVIACTGNQGCKYAAADTKAHANAVAKHLRGKKESDFPLNIHLTGCAHSCAQHYCGDIGGIATKLKDGREGYHIVLGGGMDNEQGIAREIFKGVGHDELPALVDRIVDTYQEKHDTGETFVAWTRRHSVGELQEMISV